MTKTELFIELAQPDENGVNRWVSISEFVGKYANLTFGNEVSWVRKESTPARRHIRQSLKFHNIDLRKFPRYGTMKISKSRWQNGNAIRCFFLDFEKKKRNSKILRLGINY